MFFGLDFGALPPEVNSGRLYTGPGVAPMLAAAAAWDTLALELHTAAAAYGAVVTGLSSHDWMGPASASMAAAAAPYVTWMHTTATQAERAGVQAKAAAAAYEAAFVATVPPPLIAANRTEQAGLIATNILGQNTPLIAALEALYLEMWAQDAAAMYSYAGASASATDLAAYTPPPTTTNQTGQIAQSLAATNATGNSASTQTQTMLSQLSAQVPQAIQNLTTGSSSTAMGDALLDGVKDVQTAVSPAIMVAQNGSYLFSLVNSMSSLMRAGGSGAAAAALSSPASALSAALGGSSGLAGLGGVGSAVTASLGQSGAIGALAVPQAWATGAAEIGSAASALPGTGMAATSALAANPSGLLNGMPLLANTMRTATSSSSMAPRFDLRPSLIPISPAAG